MRSSTRGQMRRRRATPPRPQGGHRAAPLSEMVGPRQGPRTLDAIGICRLHDQALAEWQAGRPGSADDAADLDGLLRAEHFCNRTLWTLEDEARRRDVEDAVIARIKRSIDEWNQRRNDLIEKIDETLVAELSRFTTPGAEQHSETAGQMIDRLSILALKIWNMSNYARRAEDPAVAAECTAKLTILRTQRRDLAVCVRRLLKDFRAGRKFFKIYRQFKAYNDPRLNPALARPAGRLLGLNPSGPHVKHRRNKKMEERWG
jgi:hypothetical protein